MTLFRFMLAPWIACASLLLGLAACTSPLTPNSAQSAPTSVATRANNASAAAEDTSHKPSATPAAGADSQPRTSSWRPWSKKSATPIRDSVSDLALPAPEALRARSGELRQVALYWEPVLAREVAGYLVERASVASDGKPETKTEAKPTAYSKTADFEPIAQITDRFQVHWLDAGANTLAKKKHAVLADGTTYSYRVRCVDRNGQPASSVSNLATATTAPAPAPPAALHAYSHLPRKIALVWDAARDPTVSHYVVYRSPSARGPFEAIGSVSGRHQNTYIDADLGDLRVFYYRVSAVNFAGGEGAPSTPERAVTKSAPLPPLGLQIETTKLGVNALVWTPNVEADLAGYRLYRLRGEGTRGAAKPELIATLDAREHAALDREVGAGETLAYQIVAFDADGLESAPSDALPVTSEDYALTTASNDGGILLRWNARRDEGFTTARVLRASQLGGGLFERAIVRTSDDSFLDAEAKPGRRYRYRVILERTDGSQAPPSAPITARRAATQTAPP